MPALWLFNMMKGWLVPEKGEEEIIIFPVAGRI
jgi:hypothetical protein